METTTEQRDVLWGVFENTPVLSFLLISQLSGDFRLAGWVAALLAAGILVLYATRRLEFHPIILAINLYLLAITPSIEAAYTLQFDALGSFITDNAQNGVLVAVFITGLALTVLPLGGLLGLQATT